MEAQYAKIETRRRRAATQVLSPAHLHSRRDSLTCCADDSLSPADRHFLKGSHRLVAEHPNSAGSSSPFDESWPSTELSTSKTPKGITQESLLEWTPFSTAHDIYGLTDGADGSPREESVIAKYMQRFRHGRPSSREERSLPVSEQKQHFWWLQSSSVKRPCPDDELSRHRDENVVPDLSANSLGLVTQNKSKLDGKISFLKEGNIGAFKMFEIDQESLKIQERAARLLQKSESSLSSSAAVSSEGVGSSPLSCISQIEEEATRNPCRRSMSDNATGAVHSLQWPKSLTPYQPALVLSTSRPEDDILYQWRLRRKMEQARDEVLSSTARMKSHSPPVRLFKQTNHGFEVMMPEPALQREANININKYSMHAPLSTPLLPNLASRNYPESLSVPPHMHHFCDIVPCPHQAWQLSSSRNGPEKRDRRQASAYHDDGSSRQKHSQQQSRSPQEASSNECESSLDVTPVDHSPEECRLDSSDHSHRKYSAQKCTSEWQEKEGHESFNSPKRGSSWPIAKGEQNSYSLCQMSKVSGSKRGTVKSSKSNDKLRETKAGAISSHQEHEKRDRTRALATTDHRTPDRDQVLVRLSGPKENYHERVKGKDSKFKEESNKYRTMPKEPVHKEVSTHHQTVAMKCVSKEETTQPLASERTRLMKGDSTHRRAVGKEFIPEEESTSGRAREKRAATKEKTNRQEASKHQGSERHDILEEDTRKGKSTNKGRHMAPADSPIRTILGQVISERLFSPPTSPKPSREKSKCQLFSKKGEPSPATKDTVKPSHLHSLEVATQLLDDAEGSDGTEFEDDPLLQVLRERRNAIIQRLRDVDTIIEQLQNQTSAEGVDTK